MTAARIAGLLYVLGWLLLFAVGGLRLLVQEWQSRRPLSDVHLTHRLVEQGGWNQ